MDELPDGDKKFILKFECNTCIFHKNAIIPLTTNIEPGLFPKMNQNTHLKKLRKKNLNKYKILSHHNSLL